jgi:putative ABC transport system ATP-binding protein
MIRLPRQPQPSSGAPAAATHSEARSGAAVDVESVSRTFGTVAALRDVTLHAAPGELLAITGRSGSGKSTLLNVIGGLVQPSAGQVLIDGEAVWQQPGIDRTRRNVVGFVFQQDLLLTELSAQANVEVPLIGAGMGRRERRERALALLAEVGLAERAAHLPSMLSGGERQRVAVARALANSPRLLLADEPTGSLDSQNAEHVIDLLAGLRDSRGMTLIIITYDAATCARADRVLTLLDGRLA